MFGIGMTEMIVIAVIALVVLGPKRLPELARTLGRTLGEFRRSATDLRREFSDVMEETRIDPPPRLPERQKPLADAPDRPAGERAEASDRSTSEPPDAPVAPGPGARGPGGTSGG